MKRKILLLFSGLLFFIATTHQLLAQASVNNYIFSTSNTGSMVLDQNGNTVDMSTGTTQVIGPNINTAGSGLFTFGFDFFYFGIRYTQVSVTSNGLIGVGNAVVPVANAFLGGNNRISVFNTTTFIGTDMGTGATGKVHWKVVGTAPNRCLVLEWLNMNITATSGTLDATFQTRLYETTGAIEFVYANMAVGANGPLTRQIGISNLTTTYQTVNTATHTAAINTTITNSYNNGIISDLNSVANGSRRTYVWTPTPTTAPGGTLTFTAVNSGGMTLNWTDLATDEVGYVIYSSSDGGVTYNFAAITAVNATSFVASGLIPNTTYLWKVHTLRESLSNAITGSQATPVSGNVIAISSGLWSQTSTWSTGYIPGSSDTVIIPAGFTVTIDMVAFAYKITIDGTLQYENLVARVLTVGNNVLINPTGSFSSNAIGTITTHNLSLQRDLINNGILNFSTNGNTAGATITFTGANNASFVLGSTSTTNLRNTSGVTVNKGTTIASGITFTPAGVFTVQGANALGFLTITNGLVELNGNFAFNNPLFTAVTYTIPASGGFRLNNPNAIITGQNGNATYNGLLRISSGNMIIGTALNNSLGFGTGAVFTVDGGNITSAGRIQTTSAITFNLSSGNIMVGAVGQNATTATFGLTSATNTLNISGGTINIIQPNTNATPLDYSVNGVANITGGVLNIGTSATTVNFDFRIQGITPNLVIDNTTNPKQALASGVLTVNGNITVPVGSTLNAQASNILVQGNINQTGQVVNDGIITNTSATGANRFQFSSTFGPQTYSGTGIFGTVALAFAGVNVQNAAGVVINAPIITNRVNLFNGIANNSGNITVGFGGTSAPTIQVGGTATLVAGSFDVAPTFNIGTGGLALTYATALTGVTTNNEVPVTRTIANLLISNSNGVTLSGGNLNITTNATFTAGQFITSASNIPTITATGVGAITGGSAASYVNGPLEITLPASLVSGSTYRFPIGKSAYKEMALVNPTTNAGGTVVIRAEVFDANSGGTVGTGLGSLYTNRYWESSLISGAANFISTDVRFTETGLSGGNRIGQSATVNGTYNSIGGVVVAPNITSTPPITSLGFFNIGLTNGTLSGTYLVGASQPVYQKLTQVAADLNGMIVTGNVTFVMMPDYDGTTGETFPIVFNPYSTTGTYNVKIMPDITATNLTTSGDPGTANTLISLNGISRLTFDGRPGGTGTTSQWLFRNTRTAATVGSTFTFINDANVDTLEYLKIEGQNISAANATVLFSTSTGIIGNSNNVILANDIRDRSDVSGVPNTSVASSGTIAAPNNNNKIIANTIRNFTGNGIAVSANSNNWIIGGTNSSEGNNVYQEASRATTTIHISVSTGNNHLIGFNNIYQTAGNNTALMTGISLIGSGNGHTIRHNNIGGSNPSRTGAPWANNFSSTANSATAMTITVGTTTVTNIYGNWISNFGTISTLSAVVNGIAVTGGLVNIGGLGANTLGGAVVSGVLSDTLRTGYDNGWINISGGTVTVENNLISNGAYYRATSNRHAGIFVSAGTNIVIRNNAIRALKGNNLATLPTSLTLSGIYCSLTGTVIENNWIDDIRNINTAGNSPSALGINWAGTTGTIRNNKISNIDAIGAQTGANSPLVYGIYWSTGNPSVYNNQVSIGANSSNQVRVFGLADATIASPGAIVHYNTVYVNGTNTAGANNSFSYIRTSTSATSLRNNFLYNERTGGTGNHVAIGNTNVTPTTNWTSATSNNNYFVTSNTAAVGMWGAVTQTLSAWKTNVIPGDGNTYSNTPVFLPAATVFINPTIANLKINPTFYTTPSDLESKGIIVASTTVDFENNSRPGPAGSVNGGASAPDIGADEFDGVPVTFDVGVLAMLNPTTGCKTATETVRFRIRNYSSAPLDLTINPVTLSSSASGPNPIVFPVIVLNAGTFPAFSNFDTAVTFTYDMTFAGTYTFNASASLVGDNSTFNDALSPAPTIIVGGGVATVTPPSVCASSNSIINLTSTGATIGSTYQWFISQDALSWNAIPTATTNPFAYTDTSNAADTLFFQVVSCGLHASTIDTLIVNDPVPPIANDTSRCGPGLLDIHASGSGSLNWFNVPTGGTSLNTGIVYTPFLTVTDTFYVENSTGTSNGAHTTTYAAGNGSSGNCFTIKALTTITITNFDGHTSTTAPGNWEVWYRPNDFLLSPGSHLSNVGWTQLGTATGVPQMGTNLVTPIPIYFSVTIPAGQTYSFQLFNNGSVNYTNGTTLGAIFNANADLQVYQGYGGTGFAGMINQPRVFNGIIHYSAGCSSSRTQVVATVTPPPTIVATSSSGAGICSGTSFDNFSTFEIASPNAGYIYNWSPATGLSSVTGDSIIAAPSTNTTYIVSANDSVTGCANYDTLSLSVSLAPQFTSTVNEDTICDGAVPVVLSAAYGPSSIIVGTGTVQNTTTTYPCVYGNWYEGAKHQILILASELQGMGVTSGNFNAMQFEILNMNTSVDSLLGFSIKMAPTAVTALTATFETPTFTTVYSVPYEIISVGVMTHNFTTPFYWDGVSNIIIETCYNNDVLAFTQNVTMNQTTTPFTSVSYFRADNTPTVCSNPTTTGTASTRPNFILQKVANYVDGWSPIATIQDPDSLTTNASPTATTNYIYTSLDTLSGCYNYDTITVNVLAPFNINPFAAPAILCAGGTDTLVSNPSGGYGNYTYLWSDGLGTGDVAYVTGLPFDYAVGVTVTDGCGSLTDSIYIDVVDPMIVTSTDTAHCGPGTGFMLSSTVTGGNGVNNYLWTGGSTSSTTTTGAVSTTTNYTVTVTDGCGTTATSVSTVNIHSLPIVNLGPDIVQLNPPALLNAGAGFTDYLWSTTQITQTISVNTNGIYTVTVTDANGCTGTDNIQVNFTIGINNPDGSAATVSYYPNPTNGILNMNIQGFMGKELKMEIMDLNGKILRNYVFDEVTENFLQQLDLSTLTAGIYLVVLRTNNEMYTHRIVVTTNY